MRYRLANGLLTGVALWFGGAAVLVQETRAGGEVVTLGDDLTVREIAPGFWLYVASENGIPANGLIAKTATGVLLIDLGWNDDQAERLLAWVEKALGRPVDKALVTHSHRDRSGGAEALRRRGVPVFATDLTVAKAQAEEKKTLQALPDTMGWPYRDTMGFDVFYPGAGHSKDNVVVFFPAAGVLFGGCLVKSEDASGMGNLADADLQSWPKAVAAVAARYPEAKVVIPGHGAMAGRKALQHTLDLLRRHSH